MSMSHGHRKQLTQQLLSAFAAMSATEWEYLGHELAEHIAGEKLRHRGLTVTGNPSGYSVDSYSSNGRVVAEYGTDPDYFEDLSKPQADFEHARREAPQAEIVLLLSNRVGGQKGMLDVASWLDEVQRNTGIIVDVYDARELTEVIFDDVLPRGCAGKIAPYLVPIARLMKEQAASHQRPASRPGAIIPVHFVDRIQSELDARRVVLLSGMSGLGKTELAVSIAAAREHQHDRVVWVDRPRLRTAAGLEAVDVAQVGMLQNLRGMLTSRSCFLVLDDIRAEGPLDALLDELTAECGPDARVLVTSQVGTGEANDIKMEFLEEGAARSLLEQDVDTPCPDDLFSGIWLAVNGHPMTLQLLNASAREEGGWNNVRLDVESVGALPVVDREGKMQSLANLLVARGREIVEPALELFAWMGSSRIHEGFARNAVHPSMIRALRRLAFIARDVPDTLRLHDIVWSSVDALRPPLQPDGARFASALHRYVQKLGSDDAGTLALNHIARLHQDLLDSLVASGVGLDGHLYAWLHHLGPRSVGRADLPDPVTKAETLTGTKPTTLVDDFSVQVTVELAETVVRLATLGGETVHDEAARAVLIRPFDILLGSANVSPVAKQHVQHHRAKALKRLRNETDAVAALEALLIDAGPLPASRLLLGRLLTEPRVSRDRPDAGARATALLLGLLEDAAASPEQASVSVVLAAAELLRRNVLKLDLETTVHTYAELLEPMITRASERGLEQGVLAFAALGAAWLRTDREQFFRIYRALPLPAWETIDRNEREAWGELLKLVANELPVAERNRTLEQALRFLVGANSRYGTSHAADALVRLGRPHEAEEMLTLWSEQDTSSRRDAWFLLRLSDAQAATGASGAALESAQQAYALVGPGSKHRQHIREQLALRLEAVGRRDEADRLRSDLPLTHNAATTSLSPPPAGPSPDDNH